MAEAKIKKSWYKQWWAIVLFVIIGLAILGGLSGNKNTPASSLTSNAINTQANPTPTNKVNTKANIPSYEQKTSGYTEAECEQACNDAYDIQAQVDVCQSSCLTFGKPSATLDKYVNNVKLIKQRKQNASS